jgi:hypothetical protein
VIAPAGPSQADLRRYLGLQQDVEIIAPTLEGRDLLKNGQAPEMRLWCHSMPYIWQHQNSSSRPQRLELGGAAHLRGILRMIQP